MARFAVQVVQLKIEPHPNADALELARIGDYLSVVKKGQYSTGDLAAYIPEQAIVPSWLLAEMGLTGRLTGKSKDRVKAIRLRGVLSQGLCYGPREHWSLGDDVTGELGIEKYKPKVPAHMSGAVWGAGPQRCVRYDIEAHRRYPEVLIEGEPVVFTEKIHGTWAQFGWMPEDMADEANGRLVVASKGFASKGLAFVVSDETRAKNLYVRAAHELAMASRIQEAFGSIAAELPVFVLGELFGRGVQDLDYGADVRTEGALGFRVFDIYQGLPGQGAYLDDEALDAACARMQIERVPVLYRGPFSEEAMLEHVDGKESISGRRRHIREGIVVRPTTERRDQSLGRVQLKRVSSAYLLRNGGTEYE